jgi:tryptophan-rich sensory protein
VLFGLVLATAVAFARVSRLAGWLLLPYLAWLVFAATLNAWIVVRN